jgi:hypothetical protein
LSLAENKLRVDTVVEVNFRRVVMKALAIVLVLVSVVVSVLSGPLPSYASQGSLWSDGVPTLTKTTDLTIAPSGDCPTYRQDVFVSEFGAPRSMCMYGDERLKIGTFFDQGRYRATVEFPYSNQMHVLEGVCSFICRYSADTDTLVTQQQVSQYGLGLVVYRHVSTRIKQQVVSNSLTKYEFDISNPDFEVKNDEGRYITTPSFAFSENGKWIVAELYGTGLALIDVDSLSVRQMTTEGLSYGYGMNPSEELAVSNDGKSVVLAGSNAGLTAYDIRDGCGQKLVGDLGLRSGSVNCPSISLVNYFPNFAAATHPRLTGTGHQLEIIIANWAGGIQRATFVTRGTVLAHQLKLLSLGDSFTSGEGETDDNFYEPGTNTGFDLCHVSTRAYLSLVARQIGIGDDDAKNLACSGARIADIIGSDDNYWGQGIRLGASGLKLAGSENRVAQENALDNYQPGRALQADFVERYDPEILTIGVGGNDAGLMGKLRTCAMPGTCEWAVGRGIEQTAGEIDRLSGKLESFYTQLKEKASTSRIFVMGYPDIIDPNGACDSVTSFLLDHTERVFVQNSIHYLNQVIHTAANKAGFMYVDVERSFDGTRLCTGGSSVAMNGVRIGDDVAIVNSLPMLRIIGAETFHPTPSGHNLLASEVLSQYPNLTNTPIEATDIGPDSYWDTDNSDGVPQAYATDFAFSTDDRQNMTVAVPGGTLQPHSIATIEVHSEPTTLATFVVDDQGGIRGSIAMPLSLKEGYHTLHLLAANRAGVNIDMYQFITMGESGSVIQSGVGEGEEGAHLKGEQHIDGSSILQIPTEVKETMSGIAGVLGAQSTDDTGNILKKLAAPALSYFKQIPVWVRWVFIGVALLVMTGLSTICTLFITKRWVKPGS